MQSNESKNWFDRLTENLNNEPQPSIEEIAQRQAERNSAAEALEGTKKESAFMKDDHAIALKYWTYKDGVIGDGWDSVQPEDAQYQDVCDKHQLKKPGDSNTITLRWINDAWVPEKSAGNAKSV